MSGSTGSAGTSGSGNTGATGSAAAALAAFDSNANSPYFTPSTYNVSQLTQTSQPDITSLVNSAMLNLVGRAATPQEIATYGTELLAAEKANTGLESTQTTYQSSGAGYGKKGATTGQTLSTGVDPTAFIENLIRGTADARVYQAATQYMQAIQESNNKYKGGF